MASALAAEAGETSGEEEEDKGFHGLKALTDGLTGLGALMGMKKEEALDLFSIQDPNKFNMGGNNTTNENSAHNNYQRSGNPYNQPPPSNFNPYNVAPKQQ